VVSDTVSSSNNVMVRVSYFTEEIIRDRCTDAVFERGRNYRSEGRIQHIEQYGDVVTAGVSGSQPYDVTVELDGAESTTQCTCPYEGPGDCKHTVAVLLEVAADPPRDESERIEPVLKTVSGDDLRAFVTDVLAREPALREQFLARFGETPHKSASEYRAETTQLFEQHTDDYPVVVEAIDFSRLFAVAEQYRERDHYLAAATVYRGLFEGIDDNIHLVDAAFDHYAKTFQSALDGYVDCVLATDPTAEEFESYAGVIDERATTGSDLHREQFMKALNELETQR
jgi:uncharacterized Zn finger protein